MRRFLLISLIILAVLAILFIGAGTGLAEVGPFHPGQTLFPLQRFAEQQRARLIGSPTQQAHFYLDLLARRSDELSAATGGATETAALVALNEALDQAVVAIGNAPEAGLEQIKIRLAGFVVKIESALAGLSRAPTEEPVLYAEMQAEISSLRNMVGALLTAQASSTESESQEAANPTPDPAVSTPVEGTPLAVAFPEGSSGAQHAFFPLSGKHATLTCTSCHINGVYAGTPNQCAICHEKWIPAAHYPGDCATCHIPTSFKDIQFDHLLAEATNCIGCHAQVKPLNHFSGLCSACHNTQAWKPANFNHQAANATNCQSCHASNRPANHYTGQCSSCHNTRAWRPANFNHQAANATNCQSCHTNDRPVNHYAGQCSNCHSTNSWKGARFDHGGQTDCQSCHASDRPANHFSGQCSSCHTTNSWKGAHFSHDGLKDCQSCHTPPGEHWNGQCSNCHEAGGNWNNVHVNGHPFPMDHGNAGGNCYACHNGPKPAVNCYTCHNPAETEKHHAEEGIIDIAGRCLECHQGGEKDD